MFTILFGVDVLTNGWITALFLATLLVAFFGQTQLFQSLYKPKETAAQNRFSGLFRRWTVQIILVGVVSTVLLLLTQLEPSPDNGLAAIFKFYPEELWQAQNIYILDDIEVTFIVLLLLLLVAIINRIFASSYRYIEDWEHYHFRTIRIQKLDLVTRAQVAKTLIKVLKTTRYLLLFLIVSTCLLFILSLYTFTTSFSQAVSNVVADAAGSVWNEVKTILPNVLILLVISFLTRLLLRVMGFFYDAIWKGKIRVNPQHHELVEPTYQLLKLLVIAFALVAAFPYIPGSSSPIFKAISIFIGFLLSLGSTSLASNIVSGIVLTYTRGLRVGDRVQVADALGDVIERTLLVTRIRTIKNVVITLPNSMVMQNQVRNFSADAEAKGLILHTTITIGYDVPWRQVEQLLIQAAQKTHHILEDPQPFVLKTSLDDFYISYELNAYTDQAGKMAATYSTLHENILDEFHQGGVEIMSPSYYAIRDGQETTIPEMAKTSERGPWNGSVRN